MVQIDKPYIYRQGEKIILTLKFIKTYVVEWGTYPCTPLTMPKQVLKQQLINNKTISYTQ